ncbi:MAG: hypothetical protein JWQ63_1771 [Mucilaginibacter sp.]|nr:hypothetical protein [Mucilaginibacter sp.]
MKVEEDVLAVLVLYKTKLSDSISFTSLTKSLQIIDRKIDLLVYDNFPKYNNNERLNGYINWNITYYGDEDNSGVSKAYNTAASMALEKNKKWLLLLDQDTDFPIQTINEYITAINAYPKEKLFVPIMLTVDGNIISPGHLKFGRGFYSKNVKQNFYSKNLKSGINNLKEYSCINCGMCIDLMAFNENNGYNELIKLDFSDHDFVRRFKTHTNTFVVIDLKVKHFLSTVMKNSFHSDKVRFKYYLDGASHFCMSFTDSFFFDIRLLKKATRQSIIHKKIFFLKSAMSYIFRIKN